MAKYTTKLFGDFYAGEKDDEIIIDAKINEKDVSILMTNANTYFNKMDICVKNLNNYIKLNKIGKKEIIKNYQNNGSARNFFVGCFNNYEEEIREKIFGCQDIEKIDIRQLMENIEPPGVVFHNDNGEIITSLSYHLHKEADELIIIEMNEKNKIKGIKYYEI